MTNEQEEALLEHFDDHVGTSSACPTCDSKVDWNVLDDILNEDGNDPLVGVVCTRCGHTRLFLARYAGVPVPTD